MLALVCALQSRWLTRTRLRPRPQPRPQSRSHPCRRGQAGQAVAEYALVLLGASAVALLVARWASGTDRIYSLLNAVIDQLLGNVR